MLPDWSVDLLKVLFGNLGAGGTILFLLCAYLVWALYQERKEHKETRETVIAVMEKRIESSIVQGRALQEVVEVLDLAVSRFISVSEKSDDSQGSSG